MSSALSAELAVAETRATSTGSLTLPNDGTAQADSASGDCQTLVADFVFGSKGVEAHG
jgi:hypothetical protein